MKVVLVRTYEDVDIDFCNKSSFTGVVISDKSYIMFYKNGCIHNPYFPATIGLNFLYKEWWCNNSRYYENHSNKSWKRKVKQLKREEKLNIFL